MGSSNGPDDLYCNDAVDSKMNEFHIDDAQAELTTLSHSTMISEEKLTAARVGSLLDMQDLQDLHYKHNELLSTEYLKSSSLRLNNQMYFKRLRKIDSKVRSYLDSAHY